MSAWLRSVQRYIQLGVRGWYCMPSWVFLSLEKGLMVHGKCLAYWYPKREIWTTLRTTLSWSIISTANWAPHHLLNEISIFRLVPASFVVEDQQGCEYDHWPHNSGYWIIDLWQRAYNKAFLSLTGFIFESSTSHSLHTRCPCCKTLSTFQLLKSSPIIISFILIHLDICGIPSGQASSSAFLCPHSLHLGRIKTFSFKPMIWGPTRKLS